MATFANATGAMISNAELRFVFKAEHFMVMPALRRRVWTTDEVDRLVDEREELTPRYELVDGELLVTAAPGDHHQRIVAELFVLLREYVNRHGIGEVRLGPARARFAADTRFEPDLFVVPAVDGRRPKADEPLIRVLLVVEVLSPTSVRHDRFAKRRYFQEHGVPEYWVVDGDSRSFEIWRPTDARPELIDQQLAWRPSADGPPFELDVARFFAGLADEP